jgi:hypothetical protein
VAPQPRIRARAQLARIEQKGIENSILKVEIEAAEVALH